MHQLVCIHNALVVCLICCKEAAWVVCLFAYLIVCLVLGVVVHLVVCFFLLEKSTKMGMGSALSKH